MGEITEWLYLLLSDVAIDGVDDRLSDAVGPAFYDYQVAEGIVPCRVHGDLIGVVGRCFRRRDHVAE